MNIAKNVSTAILHQAMTSKIPLEDKSLVMLQLAIPTAVLHGISKIKSIVPVEGEIEFAEILGSIFVNGMLIVADDAEKEELDGKKIQIKIL